MRQTWTFGYHLSEIKNVRHIQLFCYPIENLQFIGNHEESTMHLGNKILKSHILQGFIIKYNCNIFTTVQMRIDMINKQWSYGLIIVMTVSLLAEYSAAHTHTHTVFL